MKTPSASLALSVAALALLLSSSGAFSPHRIIRTHQGAALFAKAPKQASASQERKKTSIKKKKHLPESELINRRKSPALWRDDLHKEPDVVSDSAERTMVKSEVMAPAGGWPQLRAAVGNGADAVYLGLSAFSARARASNFDVDDDLPKAVAYCHASDVKVYVALNTLVFDSELEEVAQLIQRAGRAGVDALIVQDLGVAKLARKVAPNVPIHSSTQQTVTSADGVLYCLDQHEAERVVLGRELSVDEIAMVTRETSPTAEIEVFVHGALCVSYSGQCFSSEAWGGRSANRGQCAQACRLPYGLIRNGELEYLEDMTYLLSPQDQCGIDHVPNLMKAGVSCLKIEGRLKDEAYVAATTRAYRNAVDAAWEGHTGEKPSRVLEDADIDVSRKDLAQMFARGQDEEHTGLTPGFLDGTQHQMVVRGRSPRHRGVHIGRVVSGSSPKQGLIVEGSGADDLKLGDGIVVDRGRAQETELGGPIFEIQRLSDDRTLVRFGREVTRKWKSIDDISMKSGQPPLAPVDAHVWRTGDALVEKKIRRLSQAAPPKPTVRVSVSGAVGTPLSVSITDGMQTATGSTDDALQPAESAGLSPAKVIKAVGTLGNTQWALGGDIDLSGLASDTWAPISWVKEARRRAVENWAELKGEDASDEEKGKEDNLVYDAPTAMRDEFLRKEKSSDQESSHAFSRDGYVAVSVLARNIDQVETVCKIIEEGTPIDEIIVDFLEVDGMRDAAARIRMTNARLVIASPRIIKQQESGIWKTLLRLEPDGLLVRSHGLLYRMMQYGGSGSPVNVASSDAPPHMVKIPELLGDFSLNAANILTALELLDSGLQRVTASYDLNAKSITELIQQMGPSFSNRVEVIAHAKMPVFHTEHCVFARFLSNGDSYLDCGHVCTRNNVHLRDQTGADNLVLADMGCRNTVFASQSQSGVHSLGHWAEAGVGQIRIELVDEGPEDIRTIVNGYVSVLGGSRNAGAIWEELRYVRDSNGRECGVSLGSFNNKIERRAGELQ